MKSIFPFAHLGCGLLKVFVNCLSRRVTKLNLHLIASSVFFISEIAYRTALLLEREVYLFLWGFCVCVCVTLKHLELLNQLFSRPENVFSMLP